MSEERPPYEIAAAQAALDADRQRRAAEFAEVLRREAERLRCEVTAEARIVDGRIVAIPLVIAH